MSARTNDPPKRISLRIVVQLVIVVLVIPFLPLLISWRWDWWEAWVFALVYIIGFAASRLLVARHHPDLIAERARFLEQEDAKAWDKWLAPVIAFGGGLILLLAGFEMRFGLPPTFSLPVKAMSLALILAGYLLGSYALIENRFFSGLVRIQSERGHHVVSSGPYRWIRHPGYAGALLVYLAMPFWLDTLWAFPAAILLLVLLVIRTHMEDTTLRNELEGYSEYAGQVHYRLLPGIW